MQTCIRSWNSGTLRTLASFGAPWPLPLIPFFVTLVRGVGSVGFPVPATVCISSCTTKKRCAPLPRPRAPLIFLCDRDLTDFWELCDLSFLPVDVLSIAVRASAVGNRQELHPMCHVVLLVAGSSCPKMHWDGVARPYGDVTLSLHVLVGLKIPSNGTISGHLRDV